MLYRTEVRTISTNIIANYIENIHELLPNATVIKLKGYSNNNTIYDEAKKPKGKWKNSKSLTNDEIISWLDKGGWIGVIIPKGRILIDVDDSLDGEILKDLLEGENVDHHCIKTPNGYQFIFKCEAEETKQIKQVSKYVNRLGLVTDTRTSEAGYIVWPTENTENRFLVTQSVGKLDELPQYLRLIWNAQKNNNYPSYPLTEGSRNETLFDFARRLKHMNVPDKDIKQVSELIYKYFIPNKKDFSLREVRTTTRSAIKKASEGKERQLNNVQIINENITIPYGFEVIKGALYEVKVDSKGIVTHHLVSRKTPYITKEFHNVEREQVLYEIEWQEPFGKVKEIVPASTIATRRQLLELSDKGLSVNENNVKKLIHFFDQYLSINNVKKEFAVERLGMIKGKFIHPIETKDVEILSIDYGEKQLFESFKIKGTSETWKREVFEIIKDYPKATFIVLASFASVLIGELKIDPFIVDLSGSTSTGKTTTLRIAASVWGNEGLVNEWNATRVSIERKAAYLNSFPLLLDDTRKANEKVIQDIIYQFSGGRSKGRGSISGSQREYTWNNILLSTGEVTINEYAKSQGGAAARVIPIIDQPLPKDHDNIAKIYEGIENNYGAIGIDFLKIWEAKKEDYIPEYHRFRNRYLQKSRTNEVLTRLAGYYAAIHFAGSILKKELGFNVDLQAIYELFDEIAEENKAIDKPMQFLEELLTDLDSNRLNVFYNDYPFPQVVDAIYKDGQLYLLPAYLKRFLGVEEKLIRREWLKRGITVPIEDNGKIVDYKQLKHMGKNFKVIIINMDHVSNLGFNFEYQKQF